MVTFEREDENTFKRQFITTFLGCHAVRQYLKGEEDAAPIEDAETYAENAWLDYLEYMECAEEEDEDRSEDKGQNNT